jgi:hypothetical protein
MYQLPHASLKVNVQSVPQIVPRPTPNPHPNPFKQSMMKQNVAQLSPRISALQKKSKTPMMRKSTFVPEARIEFADSHRDGGYSDSQAVSILNREGETIALLCIENGDPLHLSIMAHPKACEIYGEPRVSNNDYVIKMRYEPALGRRPTAFQHVPIAGRRVDLLFTKAADSYNVSEGRNQRPGEKRK